MTTVYRIVETAMCNDGCPYVMEGGRYMGRLVPVEKCVHGRYDRHIVVKEWRGGFTTDEWCDGAGLDE